MSSQIRSLTQDKVKSGLFTGLAVLTIALLICSVTLIPTLNAFADPDHDDKHDKKDKKKKKHCHEHKHKYKNKKHCHPINQNHLDD
jgi:ABC-type nickel/cobalt efflux system permease component RcnA